MGKNISLPIIGRSDIMPEDIIPKDNTEINEIPDDQILCPQCELIPEILNVHTDSGHVELKCKYHGIIDMTIKDYYEKMKLSRFNYFNAQCSNINCNKIQNNKEEMFKYCIYCEKDFCPECAANNNCHLKKEGKQKGSHIDACIPVNEKKNRCLEHLDSHINSFCIDCEENICDREENKRHKDHEKINLTKFSDDIQKYQNVIKEKNKMLYDIIRFNNLILNLYRKFSYNYFHIISLINLGKSFEEENKRDPKEIDCMIRGLEKKKKIQNEAIKSLQEQFKIDLNGEEIKLNLRKRNLGDEGLRLISKIQFKKLKSIDVSGNNITNIDPLNDMNLPDLEYLNMSENEIRDINPIAELNSKKLKEILLQTNKIEDASPLLKLELPELKILRIENNKNIDFDSEYFKKLLKKYNTKIIYIERTVEKFNKKYGCNLTKKNLENSIDLSGLEAKDDLLQELYLMINPENKIKKLNLHNNKIKDASLLSRIPLKNLQILDISLNHIKNLKFITEMKFKKLTAIFLNDNQINDLSPLIIINDANLYINDEHKKEEENSIKKNFPELKVISLKNNYLKKEDKLTMEIKEILENNNVDTDLDLEENKKA